MRIMHITPSISSISGLMNIWLFRDKKGPLSWLRLMNVLRKKRKMQQR